MNPILELQIREVPWEKLRTADGSASHIPEALTRILSSDPTERRRAYWMIDNSVVLQGGLFEAAFFVAPFLIAMLRDRPEHGRLELYRALFEIGYGSASAGTIVVDGRYSRPLAQACRDAVLKGRAVYQRDLNDPDPAIRSEVRELLDMLEEDPP